jgi:glyoxylase-like metal-dependent hydrolase (beta-lactamase superfamily II)
MMRASDPQIARATAQIVAVAATGGQRSAVKVFFDEATFTATYVVHDPKNKRGAIIDSVLDYDPASGRAATSSADALVAYIGHLPAAEENGLRYLKIQLDAL